MKNLLEELKAKLGPKDILKLRVQISIEGCVSLIPIIEFPYQEEVLSIVATEDFSKVEDLIVKRIRSHYDIFGKDRESEKEPPESKTITRNLQDKYPNLPKQEDIVVVDLEKGSTIPLPPVDELPEDEESPFVGGDTVPTTETAIRGKKAKAITVKATKKSKESEFGIRIESKSSFEMNCDVQRTIINIFKSGTREHLERLIKELDALKKDVPAGVLEPLRREASLAIQRFDLHDGKVPDIGKLEKKLQDYIDEFNAPEEKDDADEIQLGSGTSDDDNF